LFKPNEHVLVSGWFESERQKVGNQLFLSRDQPVAVNHKLLRASKRAGHSLSVHSAKHSTGHRNGAPEALPDAPRPWRPRPVADLLRARLRHPHDHIAIALAGGREAPQPVDDRANAIMHPNPDSPSPVSTDAQRRLKIVRGNSYGGSTLGGFVFDAPALEFIACHGFDQIAMLHENLRVGSKAPRLR
jgi:hypothetical protein